ncbi:MAG: hypothetical protein BalsKO_15570 [Balneolaceae bacterium]
MAKGENYRITPTHKLEKLVNRYKKQLEQPVNLSHHKPEIVYFGSQKLNRLLNEGKDWTPISPD